MGSDPHKIPKSLDEFIDSVRSSKSEEIILQTRVDVAGFIETKFKPEQNQTLLIIEKKARLLFQPFLNRLIDKGYSPVFVRKLQDTIWTKGGPISKRYSILTDCINTGEEIASLITHRAHNKNEIDTVYCYALSEATLETLKASDPFNTITIVVAHIIKKGDPNNFSRRLQSYYQTLLEPIDTDHAYDIYQVGAPVTQSEIKEIVESGCRNVFDLELHFENCQFQYLPVYMKDLVMDLKDLVSIHDPVLREKVNKVTSKIDFDYPHFKLKTLVEKGGAQFSLMAGFILAPLNRKSINPYNGCDLYEKSRCYLMLVSSKVPLGKRWKLLCPLCIENYVERLILNQIDSEISHVLSKKGKLTVQKNDPVQREL